MSQLPDGPALPPALQAYHWAFKPTRFLDDCERRFGEWFTVRLPKGLTIVFTGSPEATKDVFSGDPDALYAGEGNAVFKPVLGEESLITLDGPRHRRARRMMMPPFHGDQMHGFVAAIQEITSRRLRAWTVGRPFPLHPELQAITLDAILKTLFGMSEGPRLGDLRDRLVSLLDDSSSALGLFASLLIMRRDGTVPFAALQERLGTWTPWGNLRSRLAAIDALLTAEITERRASSGQRNDVLSHLIAARDDEGQALTNRELRDELLTLLVAGHETTATALAWIMYRLCAHHEVRRMLLAELETASQRGPLDAQTLATLPYLDALVNETLRLHPIVPFVWRMLQRPMRLGGKDLPKGVAIAPSMYLLHRSPKLWPEPEQFRPERFLDRRPLPWEFLPFGGGGRKCLGMAFALYEMKIAAVEILRNADLELAPGYRPRIVRRGITFSPEQGLPVVARFKKDAWGSRAMATER